MALGAKILHINTYDKGGAAQSCLRLHKGLLEEGINSKLLLKRRTKDEVGTYRFNGKQTNRIKRVSKRILFHLGLAKDPILSERQWSEKEFIKILPMGTEYFSFPGSDLDIMQSPLYSEADIVHLHWVAEFVDYATFFTYNKKPVVWTLHDMGPFQGGLHYEEKFMGVGEDGLPVKKKIADNVVEVMKRNLQLKKALFDNVEKIQIVTPSKWLVGESQRSTVFERFPHRVIPYGLDERIFKLSDKNNARHVLNLPQEKKIILFVADNLNNHRKGLAFLADAFSQLADQANLCLCAVGASSKGLELNGIQSLGQIHDERLMSLVYSAADLFVIPSLEDNLPNTLLESLSCGTPVVGFPVGGIVEVIQNGVNGFVCEAISVQNLKSAIDSFFRIDTWDGRVISSNAHERFSLKRQAKDYINLYEELLNKWK